MRPAAAAAGLVALAIGLGSLTYVAVRDDPPPATTTTTTTRPATDDEVVAAIAAGLADGLDVSLDAMQATCVADGLVTALGREALESMAASGSADVDELTAQQQDALVRVIVGCVPPETAESLLSTKPPAPADETLPGDGTAP